MAEKKERNALDFKLIAKVMKEKATPEQQKAFVKVAYGYCKTITVIGKTKKTEGKEVRSFEWIKDEKEIAKLKQAGKKPSYNKKAAEEWFKANFPEEVPQPKEKTDTSSLWELWGE